jgi:hypothetical protein
MIFSQRTLSKALFTALLVGLWSAVSASSQQEPLSRREDAAVLAGIDRVREGRPLVFIFSPTASGQFCEQVGTLSKNGERFRRLNTGVVWLFSHDAIGMSSSIRTCAVPATSNGISAREMSIKGAGFNDGGSSMLYRYFSVDSEKFAIVVLGVDNRIKLRSYKPVQYEVLLNSIHR